MRRPDKPRVFDFYPLEDRVLLSGEGLEGVESPVDGNAELAASLMGEADGQVMEDPGVAVALVPPVQEEENQRVIHDVADAPTLDPALPIEVVFVDAGVDDSETLIDGLRNDSGSQSQWVVLELNAEEDGIEQITAALSGLSGVDAIHILSHGDGEGIQLGDTRLDLGTSLSYAGDIASWASAMDSDADLLIYGCDLASTVDGRALIDSIGALCDCDVAASDDVTGHADLGGDWILEYVVGDVSTDVAFEYVAQASWNDTLALITVTTTDDENDGDTSSISALLASSGGTGISLREAIIAANNTAGDDTIVLGDGVYDLTIAGDAEQAAATGDLDITSVITI
ncbi:MAG: DUF4347 domain-containing protein, partial [Rubripirellula sp.]